MATSIGLKNAASAYLNAAAGADDPGAFVLALGNDTEAKRRIPEIVARTGLNRQHLYPTLSKEGKPELRRLTKILDAPGLQFIVAARPARMARAAKKRRSKIEPAKVSA